MVHIILMLIWDWILQLLKISTQLLYTFFKLIPNMLVMDKISKLVDWYLDKELIKTQENLMCLNKKTKFYVSFLMVKIKNTFMNHKKR